MATSPNQERKLQKRILDLLETAKYAPSGGNLQPWKVYIPDAENEREMQLIFGIDKQMEIGQYSDIGMIIQNIKMLCPERGLSCSKIKFFESDTETKSIRNLFNVPDHDRIFCSVTISVSERNQTSFILTPKL